MAGPFGSLSLLEAGDGTPRHRRDGDGAPGGRAGVGVIRDGRGRSLTAVVGIGSHSFALLGADERERRVAGWASVLASLAREGSVVHRLQWLAVALPDDGRAVRQFRAERAVLAPDTTASRSYDDLLAFAGADTCRHEVFLALQVRDGRRGRGAAARRARGTCPVLLRELALLTRALAEADIGVERVLSPMALNRLMRRIGEPNPPPGTAGSEHLTPQQRLAAAGASAALHHGSAWPWPVASEAAWDRLRSDGTWHTTYWISEWPRVEVGPDFLGPLLLGPVRRRVSLVMEPLSPLQATRHVEQARTADLADSELRSRGGFLATARRAREADIVVRREAELADGHASFRFSGYVTVSASSSEALDEACDATEQAAGQARLELRRLYGDQERAFACTLPLCRGLA
jgi:hypothetical protein